MKINTKKTELALKAVSSEIDIFIVDAQAEVQALKEEYGNLVPVADTKKGYEQCKQVRKDLLPIKTKLENARRTLKAPILDAGKLIDSTLKPLTEAVESLYKPFEIAYRAVDDEKKNREAKRQELIESGFNRMDQALVSAAGSTSTVIETMIDEMADFSIDSNVFMEKSDQAAIRHSEVMSKLSEMLMQTLRSEELERKQAEYDQRIAEMEAREQKIKDAEQAEINRKIEQENAKQRAIDEERRQQEAEAQRVETERRIEEARQQAKTEAAEQARKQEQQRQAYELAAKKAEEEAREADKNHKASIHNAILESIITTGITNEQAKDIIKLAATRKAGSMYIQY
ncbi:MAG TPA: hypothetical protein VIC51_04720 [Psychromonas sp.]